MGGLNGDIHVYDFRIIYNKADNIGPRAGKIRTAEHAQSREALYIWPTLYISFTIAAGGFRQGLFFKERCLPVEMPGRPTLAAA